MPLTISRKELLAGNDDRRFRELVHAFFAFQARHEAIRDGHAAYIGLAGIQYTILISIGHLEAAGDVTVKTVCDHLRVSSAFVAVETAKLVDRGLIVKARDPKDARRTLLRTTQEGHALLAKLAPVQRAVNDIEFGGISRRDFVQLHRIMGRLIENCDAALAMQRLLERPARLDATTA
ncbi:MAG: winged helix-turn-helix transcriptional regulator [Proteobacteria bacterium]|nr:winged helix-turn-helix transcriptional regulator [Pseudomonadota bacterium]